MVWAFARAAGRPQLPLLLGTSLANTLTQSFLWAVLWCFEDHYLLSLALAELAIWLLEALAVACFRVPLRQALKLSLILNGTSCFLGLVMPV